MTAVAEGWILKQFQKGLTRCASVCLPRRGASTAGAASGLLGFEPFDGGHGLRCVKGCND